MAIIYSKYMYEYKIEKMDMIVIPHEELYPIIESKNFNSSLTRFSDFNIKGKVYNPTNQQDIEVIASKLSNTEIELSTYQSVVHNFLSNNTPYNGLLLFHGLGSGKTCSAITVAEEHRKFLSHSGMVVNRRHGKHIYILGGPIIKSNFKKQLFDASQLKKVNNEWQGYGCVRNALLREINPTGIDLSIQMLTKRIEDVIKKYYKFTGYLKFANMINTIKSQADAIVNTYRGSDLELIRKQTFDTLISREFENSMIIVDEVHNIKDAVSEEDKLTPSAALDLITKHTTIKLLLLSATPMFNDPSEIVWILNLLNRNDKRPTIVEKDFFQHGELIESEKESFINHMSGYVSYAKGENPFTFPNRIYPSHQKLSLPKLPTKSITTEEYFQPIKTSVYPVQLSEYQANAYNVKLTSEAINPSSITQNGPLLGALNMCYPDDTPDISYMKLTRGIYKYRRGNIECFSPELLGTYGAKLKAVCNHVEDSEGIVLVYSRFINGGVIPLSLALESMGLSHYSKNLMDHEKRNKFKYCTITGDTSISYGPLINTINSDANINGDKIKVVIITEAASEGVDFKNIRQIHILDPWWHLNRNEQIIGRGIRLVSHKKLPYEKRNAQIFLYVSTVLTGVELLDHYCYRYVEEKARLVGKVTRLLKENAMDCVMNHDQIQSTLNMKFKVRQILSNRKTIDYLLGDTSFSIACDFMECKYDCSYDELPKTVESRLVDTPRTIERIRLLFKNGYVYTIKDFLHELNQTTPVSKKQLYIALTEMIELEMVCWDMMHHKGYIINRGDYYVFQPHQMYKSIPMNERRIPPNAYPLAIKIVPQAPIPQSTGNNILADMEKKYELSHTHISRTISFDLKWVALVSSAKNRIVKVLKEHYIDVQDYNSLFNDCIIDHLIEFYNFNDIIELLNHVTSAKSSAIVDRIRAYFKPVNNECRIWNKYDIVYIRYVDHQWKQVRQITNKVPAINKYGTVVGGIASSSDKRVFKSKSLVKDSIQKITYGQVCNDQADKWGRLVSVLGDYGRSKSVGVPLKGATICCDLELLLRYLDKIKYNNKRWFLSATEVIDNNVNINKTNNLVSVSLIGNVKKK